MNSEIYTGFIGKNEKPKLIIQGDLYGYKYYITSCGSHPCCYIKLPEYSAFYGRLQDLDDEIEVHGGVTYTKKNLNHISDEIPEGEYFGWDYAHYGDYMYYTDTMIYEGKKYSIDDLLNDIKDVIEQLKVYENNIK